LGSVSCERTLRGNPVSPLEKKTISIFDPWPPSFETSKYARGGHYTYGVGDVCFLAIGQIVGRPYYCVRYRASANIIINSPVEFEDLRNKVRAVWSSNNPRQRLLDSLLTDYATQGELGAHSIDGWGLGSNFQTEAALRLLYYFPNESASLIAANIKRNGASGVVASDFIRAVAWSRLPAIHDALDEIAKRTDDPEIKAALEGRK
jgi:hypothetical protein